MKSSAKKSVLKPNQERFQQHQIEGLARCGLGKKLALESKEKISDVIRVLAGEVVELREQLATITEEPWLSAATVAHGEVVLVKWIKGLPDPYKVPQLGVYNEHTNIWIFYNAQTPMRYTPKYYRPWKHGKRNAYE